MASKSYGIHDKWTDINKINNVDIKSVDGVIESVKINGEEAGGGGGGDFTTAKVTVINNTGDGVMCYVPYVDEAGSAVKLNIGDEPVTISVILYQGSASFRAPNGTLSATGDIVIPPIPSPTCLINGNGTITIS